ncbi:uncharacterized protein [Amphiura filiformis]|uniref:uncharacterized protein n=1 Tax=Amphiura filiformis TaxID=82378 RepID=UPI003B214B50
MTSSAVIEKELSDLRSKCTSQIEGSEVITCHPAQIRVQITKTKYKKLVVCLQFPADGYPSNAIVIEIKSKTIPERLCNGFTTICDAEAKKLCGKPHVLDILLFIRKFLDDNPFTVCSDELAFIKKELITDNDEIKTKQKAGVITLHLKVQEYFVKLKCKVPNEYPEHPISVELDDSNFPGLFKTMFVAQATELARRRVQPPLKKPKPGEPPFEPKPSLRHVVEYLVKDCIRRFPVLPCPVCKERAFPKKPEHVINDPKSGRHVEWMYCGHVYHHGCVDAYMKIPPFTGGKKCPDCGKRIYHDKWNIAPKLSEDRWAHEQARQREIDEVVEFLS